MKAVILYRPRSEHARDVETFVHDFEQRHSNAKLELLNMDEREGIATASLYDIMQFPTIMVLATDGSVQHLWEGSQLPMLDEVAAYFQTR